MRKLLHILIRASGVLAAVLLLVMVVVMFLSIFLRQFGIMLTGSEDVATFSMVGLAFLGLPTVYVAGMHIRVETIFIRFSETSQRWINVFCIIIGLAVCCVLIYFSAVLVWDSYRFGDTSFGLLVVPLWIPQFPIPVGLTLFALALADDLGQLLQGSAASFQKNQVAGEPSHAE